jgi:proteasome assembly chaperone (PAC2) family protein
VSDAYRTHDWPELNAPVLLVNLQGFIDAGSGGLNAMAQIDAHTEAKTIVTFDPDLFIDHRARRPIMQLREGVNTGLVWPEIVLKHGRDSKGNDVLLLSGSEPDTYWHRFCDTVTQLAGSYGVRMMVGLGAYPIGVPHTRPSRLSTSASSADLAKRFGFNRDSLDAPAGAASAIEERLTGVGIPAIGLWAQVPHYVANSPYPGASLALLDALHDLAGVAVDTGPLRRETEEHRGRLDQLVAANPEHVQMLRQLEAAWDEMATQGPALDASGPLPSGDELAAELEKFLRDK